MLGVGWMQFDVCCVFGTFVAWCLILDVEFWWIRGLERAWEDMSLQLPATQRNEDSLL